MIKQKKCEIIYNDYNVFKYEYKTIEEAKTIYDELKSNNFNDFYFRVFSKDFDYIHNYGEEIYDLERIEPNEVLYLNETIEGLPNNKAKGKKRKMTILPILEWDLLKGGMINNVIS